MILCNGGNAYIEGEKTMILRTQRQLKVWEIALGIGLAATLLSGAGAMRTQTE